MAQDYVMLGNLRTALARENAKLIRQTESISATEAMIMLIEGQIKLEENKK